MGFFSRQPKVQNFRFGFENDRAIPAVLVVEPWAYDYTLEPGQRAELLFRSASPNLWFNVVNDEDGTVQVYLEGEAPTIGVDWDVLIEGTRVEIGHGRRP